MPKDGGQDWVKPPLKKFRIMFAGGQSTTRQAHGFWVGENTGELLLWNRVAEYEQENISAFAHEQWVSVDLASRSNRSKNTSAARTGFPLRCFGVPRWRPNQRPEHFRGAGQ
jgi:hypothetical protein